MIDGGRQVRLTEFSHGAGCACKLSPADLEEVLTLATGLGVVEDDRLLVGLGTADDAAVFKVRDDLALVFTTDFFTPIVDDPYDWGRIAATNALSDIYAMGGTPLLALNIVAWPRKALPLELLAKVLEGGARTASDAGCLVVGGHSIDDAEPKYGMAVLGTVHPDEVLTNGGAQPGDELVLTKPLGVGAITTACKRSLATPQQMEAACEVMTMLNAGALVAARTVGVGPGRAVHAATDVTGFGLVGHLSELIRASNVSVIVDYARVPVIDGTRELLLAGAVSGGTIRNHAWATPSVNWGDLTETDQYLLADAQTSGGLVLACAPAATAGLVAALEVAGSLSAAVIGRVETADDRRPITVV